MSRREQNKDIVRELLSEYYSRLELQLPHDFVLREFAFQSYVSRKYVRHLSFQSKASLREYLVKETPRNAYYSVAIYRDPAAERMEDKGLIGAELMFDIDVDHIDGCRKETITLENGKVLHTFVPECIELGKKHELMLIDILKNDFGFSWNEIRVYFTGNRGFHTVVHPKDDEWLRMDSMQRREIVDYIKGIGLDISIIFPFKRRLEPTESLKRSGGWRTRLLRTGISIQDILDNPEIIKSVAVEIDEQVTQDTSRLVRILRTINGKSGIPSVPLDSESDIVKFSFSMELSPFKGDALVKCLVDLPSTILALGERIGLMKEKTLLVPLPIAVYLHLNDLATIVRIM